MEVVISIWWVPSLWHIFFGGPPLKNTGYPPERAHFNYPFIFALQITTCFSKIFNECPLHIYCTGLWVNPSTGGETEIIMIVFTVIFIDIWWVVSCHASKNLCDRPSLHFGRTWNFAATWFQHTFSFTFFLIASLLNFFHRETHHCWSRGRCLFSELQWTITWSRNGTGRTMAILNLYKKLH